MLLQEPSRLLVVEDEASIRRALTAALRAEGYGVRGEATGESIEEVAASFRPHLALLDIRLPVGPDGYEIARVLRRQGDLPIIFLTAADALRARLDGFAAGGDDYLVKPFALDELLARVKALLRRSGRTPTRRQVGDLIVDEDGRSAVRSGTDLELTRKEYDVLVVLVRNVGQVLSKGQILRLVWGYDAYDENLIEVHMSSLRRKLEAVGPRLIHTVRGVGYVMRP
ncbi:MAG TPA: response regulator transcription factor [Acidimicrobiales bacterium]|nr:response regulator transcription factor [Acidimicrobiales bacterium]